MTSPIPKIVHMSWPHKQDLEHNQSPIILNGLRNIIDLNPDWQVFINDDDDIDNYLRENLSRVDHKLLEDRHIVEKSDVWRLIKIYNEGGMYIDIDRFYNQPMSEILGDNISCVLPMCGDYDFSQDIMISAPMNPIFKNTFDLVMERRRLNDSNSKNVYHLGPQSYMHAITLTLFGEMINTNPGLETIKRVRDGLKKIPFIKTYKETQPLDTLVYQHRDESFKMGNTKAKNWPEMKKEFYDSYGIKHWLAT